MAQKAVQQFMLGTVLNTEAQARGTLSLLKTGGYDGIELCAFMIHPTPFVVKLLAKALGVEAVILESHKSWLEGSPVKSFQKSAEFLNRHF